MTPVADCWNSDNDRDRSLGSRRQKGGAALQRPDFSVCRFAHQKRTKLISTGPRQSGVEQNGCGQVVSEQEYLEQQKPRVKALLAGEPEP